MLTHNEPSPNAIAPPPAGAPSSIVFVTLLVFGSIRSTLPSFAHSTQTELSPVTTAVGAAETSIDLSTRLVCGSTRKHPILRRTRQPQRASRRTPGVLQSA